MSAIRSRNSSSTGVQDPETPWRTAAGILTGRYASMGMFIYDFQLYLVTTAMAIGDTPSMSLHPLHSWLLKEFCYPLPFLSDKLATWLLPWTVDNTRMRSILLLNSVYWTWMLVLTVRRSWLPLKSYGIGVVAAVSSFSRHVMNLMNRCP
jgi:hypothetical protein